MNIFLKYFDIHYAQEKRTIFDRRCWRYLKKNSILEPFRIWIIFFISNFFVGISSGKSTVCKKIIEELAKLNKQHQKHVVIISLDSFYKRLSEEERLKAERNDINLDHPDAFDDELAYNTLIDLIKGHNVEIPVYDKKTYKPSQDEKIRVNSDEVTDVLILEGILVFYYPKIRDLCQMKLFVDCDADTRLARRVLRDMKEYNRPLEGILSYYQKFVKPAFEEFCLPTKKYADVIIPRGVENNVAINLIVQHLNDYLNTRSTNNSPRGSTMTMLENNNATENHRSDEATASTANSSSTNGSIINIPVNNNLSPQKSAKIVTGATNTPSKRNDLPSRPH